MRAHEHRKCRSARMAAKIRIGKVVVYERLLECSVEPLVSIPIFVMDDHENASSERRLSHRRNNNCIEQGPTAGTDSSCKFDCQAHKELNVNIYEHCRKITRRHQGESDASDGTTEASQEPPAGAKAHSSCNFLRHD